MSDRIEQCKADIVKLQEELTRLEDEAKPRPRHGDIVRCRDGAIRIVVSMYDGPHAYDSVGCQGAGPNGVIYCYKQGFHTVVGNVFDQAGGK